jgi:hypothetical protein
MGEWSKGRQLSFAGPRLRRRDVCFAETFLIACAAVVFATSFLMT